MSTRSRITRLAIALLVTLAAAGTAWASASDFAFELKPAKLTAGKARLVDVRLVNRATGQPVANAVIFRTRLDMAPDNMAEMTAPVAPAASPEPGVYRFKVDLDMAGRWALRLAAKVPGEPETVTGDVILVAAP